ncbi:uncharacterized protein CDV56_100151 [Aspergillus thermomutatus]|uniref:Heterokaryon incompatibility domain-containing protein n=1 Tax=Aspergillus thermomutatus TaxID=41047 RepID=A0A397G3X0_ASPTH|nr:uncharacterized protein CDV56_100151 [Aspergillus thermomutatus]RHZ45307.1 hypothetical protein CDV56_100151 [Aspergillus thermomutatus]
MDHLILPRTISPKPLKVPALSSINYDGGDFDGYPERQGWGTRTVAEWQAIFENPPREFNAFLQRWLYFGLMHFFIGPFDISTFVVDDTDNPGMMILSTKPLKDFIERNLRQRKQVNGLFGAIRGCGDVLFALDGTWKRKRTGNQTLQQPERLRAFLLLEQPSDPQHQRVTLSESLLWEMAVSYPQSFGQEVYRMIPSFPQHSIRTLLCLAGWCPSDIMPMMQEFTTAGCLFMMNLERPSPTQVHVAKNGPVGSPSCTQTYCRFRNLSGNTYTTKHKHECQGCPDLVVELSILAPVLLSDRIPLIHLQSRHGSDRLSIMPETPGTPYIAISHVWSDGLGNLQRNALPSCQFTLLRNLIHSLPTELSQTQYVWVDTLCVPPDAVNHERAQAAALRQMRHVYEGASAVLVLDSWLLSCDSSGMSKVEVLMRIFNSVWNRRLWTYQEGALARLLFFQFNDKAHELDSYYQLFLETRDVLLDLTLKNSLKIRYQSLRGFKQSDTDFSGEISSVISALRFRTTSVASDEALCIATLLNLDMGRIVQSRPNERMEVLWSIIPTIPSEILCYRGETLTRPGLRWAPKSFLLSSSNVNPPNNHYIPAIATADVSSPPLAQITPAGLIAKLHGIVMDIGMGRLGMSFMMKDNLREHHLLFVFAGNSQHAEMASDGFRDNQEEIPSIQPHTIYGTGKIAFLVVMHPGTENLTHRRVGILAAITHEDGDVVRARKICGAIGELQKPSTRVVNTALLDRLYPDQVISERFEGPPGLGTNNFVVRTAFGQRRASQLWCID